MVLETVQHFTLIQHFGMVNVGVEMFGVVDQIMHMLMHIIGKAQEEITINMEQFI
jgi:hypothetical protein